MKLPSTLLFCLPILACQSAAPATQPTAPSTPTPVGEKADWAFRGSWIDACCCKVSCPCLFGTGPTEGFCEGASLFEIEAGHHDGVALDGVSAVVAYRVKGWTRIVVDEGASPEQVAAVGALVPRLLRFVQKGPAPSVTAGNVEVVRGEDSIRYATDETAVELALVESATGDPILLHNLPAKGTPFPVSHEHTQYVSRELRHSSSAGAFEWSGRNGFTSKIDLGS